MPPVISSDPYPPAPSDPAGIRAVHAYWDKVRAGRVGPAWRDIDLLALPAPLLPFYLVSDLVPGRGFVYRYWGRAHTAYHGVDHAGHYFDEVGPRWARQLLKFQYDLVLEKRAPLVFHTVYQNLPEALRSLRPPLSDDGENITGIFSYVGRGDVEREMQKLFGTKNEY